MYCLKAGVLFETRIRRYASSALCQPVCHLNQSFSDPTKIMSSGLSRQLRKVCAELVCLWKYYVTLSHLAMLYILSR